MSTSLDKSMSELSEGYAVALASCIRAIEQRDFVDRLYAAIDELCPSDSRLALVLRAAEPPVVVHEQLSTGERALFYERYLKHGYVLSPYYQLWKQGGEDGFFRMRDIVPEDFSRSRIYRDYYIDIGLLDEGAFLVNINDSDAFMVWFGRCNREFADYEINALNAQAPLVLASCWRHWEALAPLLPMALDPQRAFHQYLEAAIGEFGKQELSAREAQIARLILRGFSTQRIARHLEIAAGTVKNHRNHLYEKLGISSQGELFSLFLTSVTQAGKV